MKINFEILFFNLIYILFFSLNLSLAQEINKETISKLTESFLITRTDNQSRLSKTTLREIQNVNEINHGRENITVGYLVRLNPSGFVILSKNKNLPPVIAYSLYKNFPYSKDSTNLILKIVEEDLNYRQQNVDAIPANIKERNRKLWDDYLNHNQSISISLEHWPEQGTTESGGWIETTWHQREPYNQFCPIDPNTNERSVVGCGPLALAQIVNYHKYYYNKRFSDQDKYITANSISIDDDHLSLDFPSFDELNIKLDSLQIKYQNKQILNDRDYASLCFTIGILTNVQFSSIEAPSEKYDLLSALTTKINYPYVKKMGMNEDYLTSLKNNIKTGLPAIIFLNNDAEGHAVVCDGYNTDDFYHINFGWGSNSPKAISDCWYFLDGQLPHNFVLSNLLIDIIPGVDETILTSTPGSVIEFQPVLINKKSEVESCMLRNNSSSIIYIDEIKAPEYFKVSTDGLNYYNNISDLYINPMNELELFIYSIPDSIGKFIETLEIKLTQNNVSNYKKIQLHSYGKPELGTLITEKSVSGNWDASHSPYIIIDDVFVESDKTLTILPGTTIRIMHNSDFIIGKNSQIIAIGNDNEPIYFISFKTELGCNGLTFNSSGNDDIFENCVFNNMGNKGIEGGAIKINSTNLTLNNITFSNNKAANGGALYVNNSNLDINNVSFFSNKANFGGAIYLLQSTVNFTKNMFRGNLCTEQGGIIYSNNSKLAVLNSILDSNRSYDKGNILAASNSELLLKNITAVKYGGTNLDELFYIRVRNSLEIKNSIFWNNELSDSAISDDLNFGNSKTDIRAYDIFFNFNNCDASFVRFFQEYPYDNILGHDNISRDPKFINFNEGDFRLLETSPCIDSGDLADDVGDEPYPHAFHINMGAFGGTSDAAITNELKLTIDHAYFDFGEQSKLTDSDNQIINFNLKNGCIENIHIESMYIEDSTCINLIDKPNDLNFTLTPHGKANFSIKFNYSKAKFIMFGSYQTNLIIEYNDTNKISVPIYVQIQGTVIEQIIGGILKYENSPYQINQNVQIPPGTSLIIEPGVVILFNNNSNLKVGHNAKLVAKGRENDSIYFIGLGKIANNYIEFYESGVDDTLQYCVVNNLKSIRYIFTAPTILNTLFSNNNAIQETLGFYSCGSYKISNCRFENNNKDYRLILSSGSSGIIENTVFYNNTGICLDMDGQLGNSIKLQNLTIVENESPNSVIKISNMNTENNFVEVRNSIIGRNRNPSGSIFEMNSANSSIDYCNIDTNYNNWLVISEIQNSNEGKLIWGDGNISADPMFINLDKGNLILQEYSPCVDAGDPEAVYNDMEDPVNIGFAQWPARGTIRNDMGAYGGGVYNYTTSIIDGEDIIIPEMYYLYQNYPNPFNPVTTIKYSIPLEVKSKKSKVKNVILVIFDILGREVAVLVDEVKQPGRYSVQFDATALSSGIYYYQLKAGEFTETKKMVLMK